MYRFLCTYCDHVHIIITLYRSNWNYTYKSQHAAANMVLSTFSICDPRTCIVKTVHFSSYCLSLYGGILWNAACNQLKSLEIAFNNILRRIWKLPRNSHASILHKVAQLDSMYNRLIRLSDRFSQKMHESKWSLLYNTFNLFYNQCLYSCWQ